MRRWIVGFCVLSACGSAVEASGDEGASSGGTVTGDAVEPGVPEGSSGASATGSTTTGAADADASSGNESSTGEPALSSCDPQPGGPSLGMMIDERAVYETEHLEIVDTCQVGEVRMEREFLVLDFDCPQGPVSVSVSAPTLPDLAPQDTVELSLFVDSPWWGNAYVKVMRDGALQLAVMAGESLPNGARFLPPEDFFAPLTLELRTDVCEPEEDEGSSFLGDHRCTRDRRLAIAFALGGDSTTVFDRNAGTVGELSIDVGRTVQHEEVSCTDTPGGWREFIAVRAKR